MLDNKRTSKIALYFLMWWVFAIIVSFNVANAWEYEYTDLVVKRTISQPGALQDDIRTGGVIQLTVNNPVEAVIREVAEKENFAWTDYIVRLGQCESSLNPNAKGDGKFNSRGVFQISKWYHPEVSDECAFDTECATKWAIKKINAGQQHLWSCDKVAKLK